jgi:hypothetical protein
MFRGRILEWLRWSLLIAGCLTLGYTGAEWASGRIEQAKASRELDRILFEQAAKSEPPARLRTERPTGPDRSPPPDPFRSRTTDAQISAARRFHSPPGSSTIRRAGVQSRPGTAEHPVDAPHGNRSTGCSRVRAGRGGVVQSARCTSAP